jgi:hypothetical protein
MSELEKVKANQHLSQPIGAFLDWMLHSSPYIIAEDIDGELQATNKRLEEILAEYFEIDLKKVEAEKWAILESLQNCASEKP